MEFELECEEFFVGFLFLGLGVLFGFVLLVLLSKNISRNESNFCFRVILANWVSTS